MSSAIIVNPSDNVATALTDLTSSTVACNVTLLQDIPKGHKFALTNIYQNEPVLKYNSVIGKATCDIPAGTWVHIHNTAGTRGCENEYSLNNATPSPNLTTPEIDSAKINANQFKQLPTYSLQGYRRPNGDFGLRNHILIIPSVHCANKTVEQIANYFIFQDAGRDDTRVRYVTHQHGCSELAFDAEQTQTVFAGTGANPNVYAVLVIGLGCEVVQPDAVSAQIKQLSPYKEVAYMSIQKMGGQQKSIEHGRKIVAQFLEQALLQTKSDGTLADLILGTECGGSDSFSGLSANPALGVASDIVVAQGGSVILAETTELIGAEHLLAQRACNNQVRDQLLKTIHTFEQNVIATGCDIRGANPSPGNIAGGLSSIEEKSLGCIYKAGTQPIMAIVDYAKPITAKGVTLMNTPGNDIEQLSGMVAGGCNICVFTTGRGTPTGSPIVPTIKVSTNTFTANNMSDCIDINAGLILDGEKTIEQMGHEIINCIVRISQGELIKAEVNQQNDFSVWRLATTV